MMMLKPNKEKKQKQKAQPDTRGHDGSFCKSNLRSKKSMNQKRKFEK